MTNPLESIYSYVKESILKLRKDLLSKLFYDILKWIFLSLILLLTARYSTIERLSNPLTLTYSFTLFEILIGLFCSVGITIFFLRLLFQAKYRALEKDNNTDELTGLRNHKALKQVLANKISTVNVSQDLLSIIIIDIDNFKDFNTQFGYAIADKVLAKVGLLLANDKRITDEVFRQFLRGDEFVIIATNTSASEAFQAAERKRSLIANASFMIEGIPYQLTVSCGVTEYVKGDTYESLTQRASSALMKAKATTAKNCTVTFV